MELSTKVGLTASFLEPIDALKPWVQASRKEYHEPHKQNKKMDLYRGPVDPILAISTGILDTSQFLKIEIVLFLWASRIQLKFSDFRTYIFSTRPNPQGTHIFRMVEINKDKFPRNLNLI